MAKPRLIFTVTEDWYFYSHRRPMIAAAQDAGFEVSVVTNVDAHRDKIEALGVKVIPFSFARRSLNLFQALAQIFKLKDIYRKEQPDIVHHIAMKPILFGSMAAWMADVPCVINAFAGLGYVFNARHPLAYMLKLGLWPFFLVLLRRPNSHLLFQNSDDLASLKRLGLVVPARAHVIRGSGIDLEAYPLQKQNPPSPDFICIYAGRMIAIKGLQTLKEAFALLERKVPQVRLKLYGKLDSGNPGAWSAEEIQCWVAGSDNVSYEGVASNMAEVWGSAHVALQASYGGEGVPKSLLEAAACGRAIIASDVPGCREVVEQGHNGFLVPPYDAHALARALEKLWQDWDLCRAMGEHSRKIVEGDLSAAQVQAQMAALYTVLRENSSDRAGQ